MNVPFVRFKEYIEDLRRKGLVRPEPELELTDQGIRYLQEYGRVRQFLEQFGLAERKARRRDSSTDRDEPDPRTKRQAGKRPDETIATQGDKS